MLVVKIEVWPGGEADRATEISRVGIVNLSGMAPISNYEMTALISRDGEEHVVKSEINSHERNAGWAPLVRRVMTNIHLADSVLHLGAYDDPVAELLRKGHRV